MADAKAPARRLYEEGDIVYVEDNNGDLEAAKVLKVLANGNVRLIPCHLGSDRRIVRILSAQYPGGKPGKYKNAYFTDPKLPPEARFGGYDERKHNAWCNSDDDALTLVLPAFYRVVQAETLQKLHAKDPKRYSMITNVKAAY